MCRQFKRTEYQRTHLAGKRAQNLARNIRLLMVCPHATQHKIDHHLLIVSVCARWPARPGTARAPAKLPPKHIDGTAIGDCGGGGGGATAAAASTTIVMVAAVGTVINYLMPRR